MLRCLNSKIVEGKRKDFFGKIPFIINEEVYRVTKMGGGKQFDNFLNEIFFGLRKDNQKFLESGELYFAYKKKKLR